MAGIGFNLSQQQRQIMTLAPQMRQSLEMLQMPVMALKEAIIKEMAVNPTVEMTDPTEIQRSRLEPESRGGESGPREMDFSPNVDALLQENNEWRDYFMQGMENAPSAEDAEERRQYFFDSIRQPVSLQNHLDDQLGLLPLNGEDHDHALNLIGNISDDGYFTGSLPDIIMISGKSEKHILKILELIQTLDPPGVGARNLRECLLAQMEKLEDSPWEEEVRTLIDRYLEKLAAHDDKFLCKALELSPDELKQAIAALRSLNPRPGNAFESRPPEYIHPEVYIYKEKGRFVAHVESRQLPQIHISNHYQGMLEDPGVSAETKSYIRDRIRAGAFLIHSIEQRQETIRKIAQTITDAQTRFLEEGVEALKPMTMAEVAEKVGVHETTVSRTVANKYMRTPVGTYEMRYFFTAGLKGKDGAVVSNRSIQDQIKRMIETEDPAAPLSDQAIVNRFAEQGLKVARRTVNKYRDILKIPAAHKRRRVQ